MLKRLEETRLLALCMCSDNREAFSRLVELHQQGLRRFLMNLCGGDLMLTDDLAQDTFLKAWISIRLFRGLSGFRTWLYRIALNEYISYRRSRSNCMLNEASDAADLHLASPVDAERRADAGIDARTMLAQLSESEKTISLLFYLEELPIKEIVKITGMAEGTVKSHLSRARKKMAEIQ